MRPILKWAVRLVAAAAGLALVAVLTTWGVMHATVPALSGRMALAGLTSPVEIIRDREGVPHIFAPTPADGYFALGFVHAQDRMWQMELTRRAGQGRLSEMFGEETVTTDIFMRTLDFHGLAERSLAALSPRNRALIEAYAQGVNAYLERKTGLFEPRLAPEFLILRHRPEPWRAADCILALKMMALTLGTNLNHEVTRLSYAAQGLSPAEIEDLLPPNAGEAVPPLPDIAALLPLRRVAEGALGVRSAALEAMMDTGASNNWVVSGARTVSGRPLLANDPHLRLTAPSTWYLVHLALGQPDGRTLNAVGATLAGVPLVVLGRTETVAWGFTNTGADVQDLFIEKVNPANTDEYLTPQGWRRFETDEITIRIKGQRARVLERRRTRHGPVLPASYRNLGALLGEGHVAALQWTALSGDDTTIEAGMWTGGEQDVTEYFARMRNYVGPMQSMVVADVKGRIGMIAPGRVPVRDRANRIAGRAPVPGWQAVYDWKGLLPFEALPRSTDPPAGAIGTANARMVPPEYPSVLTWDWDADYRQRRIDELVIAHEGKHDVASMRAAQLDVLSPAAREVKALMIVAARAQPGADVPVLDQLAAWDATMRPELQEPLIYMAWVRAAVSAIYREDLGSAFLRFYDEQALVLVRLLKGQATARDWCDDRRTPERETCTMILVQALRDALADLTRRYGPDRRQWSWGRAHVAVSEHRPLGRLPLIGAFFNIEVPSPGGNYTLNRGKVDFDDEPPFASRHASSYRAIYDLADLDASVYMHTTGQSGNPFSRLYRNLAARWAAGEYFRIATRREEVARSAVGSWRLEPAGAR